MKKQEIISKLTNGRDLVITISYDNGKDYPFNPKGIYARLTEMIVRRGVDANGREYDLSEWHSNWPSEKVLLERVERGSQKKVDTWCSDIQKNLVNIVDRWNDSKYIRACEHTASPW